MLFAFHGWWLLAFFALCRCRLSSWRFDAWVWVWVWLRWEWRWRSRFGVATRRVCAHRRSSYNRSETLMACDVSRLTIVSTHTHTHTTTTTTTRTPKPAARDAPTMRDATQRDARLRFNHGVVFVGVKGDRGGVIRSISSGHGNLHKQHHD